MIAIVGEMERDMDREREIVVDIEIAREIERGLTGEIER